MHFDVAYSVIKILIMLLKIIVSFVRIKSHSNSKKSKSFPASSLDKVMH